MLVVLRKKKSKGLENWYSQREVKEVIPVCGTGDQDKIATVPLGPYFYECSPCVPCGAETVPCGRNKKLSHECVCKR